jgi:hypothetical protein
LKYDEVKFIYLFFCNYNNLKPQTTHHCKLKIHTLFFFLFFFHKKKPNNSSPCPKTHTWQNNLSKGTQKSSNPKTKASGDRQGRASLNYTCRQYYQKPTFLDPFILLLCKDLFFSSSDLSNFFFLGLQSHLPVNFIQYFFIKEIVKLESFFFNYFFVCF